MGWVIISDDQREQEVFHSMANTLELTGEVINSNWMSRLVRAPFDDRRYYIKSYASRGRRLRKYLGRSRLRAEWENLQKFNEMGIATATVVAFGEGRDDSGYQGVMVTREVEGTSDLASIAASGATLGNRDWRRTVIRRLSESVRTMHGHGFVHNDLKWRNILAELSENPRVYVIDCPQGRSLFGLFLKARHR